MREKIRKKARDRKGFTLAEVLMAVLILLLVTAVVAGGLPAATNAYGKVVDASNAQVLLSTTVTRLRDELRTATGVTVSGTTIRYTSAQGITSTLEPKQEKEGTLTGIQLMENGDADSARMLVSREAAGKNLSVAYETASYADGMVTITNLQVSKGSQELSSVPVLKIRVLAAAAG